MNLNGSYVMTNSFYHYLQIIVGTRSSTNFAKPSELPLDDLKKLYQDCDNGVHSLYGTSLLRAVPNEESKDEPSKFS